MKELTHRILEGIKILVLFLSFVFIAFKLLNEDQFRQLINMLKTFNTKSLFLFLLALTLMFLNWIIEAVKWRFLINRLEQISLFKSFRGVISGITVSIFTPNRTGEFAGRILVLKPRNRIRAVFGTFIGNIAQLITTVILGLISIVLYPELIQNLDIIDNINNTWTQVILIAAILLILLLYFNLDIFNLFLQKLKFMQRFQEYIEIFFACKNKEKTIILLLSLARYFTFLSQFILLLYLFNVNIQLQILIPALFLVYLSITIIPSIALAEIGIRGSVSIFFLGFFTENLSGVFLASSTLWLINLAIPALVGAFIIYKTKI